MQKLRKALIFIFSLGILLAYTPVYAEPSNPTSSPEPSAETTELPENTEEQDDSYSFGDAVKSLLRVFSRRAAQPASLTANSSVMDTVSELVGGWPNTDGNWHSLGTYNYPAYSWGQIADMDAASIRRGMDCSRSAIWIFSHYFAAQGKSLTDMGIDTGSKGVLGDMAANMLRSSQLTEYDSFDEAKAHENEPGMLVLYGTGNIGHITLTLGDGYVWDFGSHNGVPGSQGVYRIRSGGIVEKGSSDGSSWESFSYAFSPGPQNRDVSVEVYKSSDKPEYTSGNPNYSLAGAEYGIYKNRYDASPLATMTTDASGYAKAENISVSDNTTTLYVHETYAPSTFDADPEWHPVDVSKGNGSFGHAYSTDAAKNDPLWIVINKKSSEGKILKDNVAPLDNAQFTIKYYKNTYTSLDQLAGVASTKTWVIGTKKQADGSYEAHLSDNYIVPNSGSDALDKDSNNMPIVYYGTLTIEETKAPEGYVTDGSTQYTLSADGTKTDITEKVALFNVNEQFTTNGGSTLYMANKGDVKSDLFQRTEKTARGGFSIAKRDVHFGSSTSGDSTNLIGTFSIFNNNNYATTLKYGDGDTDVVAIAQPKEYFHKVARDDGDQNLTELTGDDNIYTVSTDSNGNYTSFTHALQTGSYTLYEVSAPIGYDVKATKDLPITIVQDEMPTFEIKNKPVYQRFEIQKQVSSHNKPAPKDITIELTIRNRSKFPIYISDFTDGNKWKEVKPGDLVYANPIKTDSKGYVKSPEEALPYGTYEIVETKAPAGVSLLSDPITMRVDENGQIIVDGEVANDCTIILNDSYGVEVLRAGGDGTSKYIGAGALAIAVASLVAIATKIKR